MLPTVCPQCGAKIVWRKTINGVDAPLDEAPTPEGNLIIDEMDGRVRTAGILDAGYRGPRYTNHFRTCEKLKVEG